MSAAPVETNIFKAMTLMATPGFINFAKVDFGAVWKATMHDFGHVIVANWKVWPAIALVNFSVIKTVRVRTLVLSLAGLGWRVYLSLFAAA